MLLDRPTTHYYSASKNAHHGDAVIQGFGANRVPVENRKLEEGTLHIVGGLQFGSLDLMIELRSKPQDYLFMDRAYFGGGARSNVLRIVPNAYQHHWMLEADIGPRTVLPVIQPWRKGGECIMVVPPSPAICLLFDLGDWLKDTLHMLSQITLRPIFVSRKGDSEPLKNRLERCHCVVTYTSNVAVEAICFGVPSIVSKHSAARPLAHHWETMDEVDIEVPVRADDKTRAKWANALTWGQFTVDEIASGCAKSIMRDMFEKQGAA